MRVFLNGASKEPDLYSIVLPNFADIDRLTEDLSTGWHPAALREGKNKNRTRQPKSTRLNHRSTLDQADTVRLSVTAVSTRAPNKINKIKKQRPNKSTLCDGKRRQVPTPNTTVAGCSDPVQVILRRKNLWRERVHPSPTCWVLAGPVVVEPLPRILFPMPLGPCCPRVVLGERRVRQNVRRAILHANDPHRRSDRRINGLD